MSKNKKPGKGHIWHTQNPLSIAQLPQFQRDRLSMDVYNSIYASLNGERAALVDAATRFALDRNIDVNEIIAVAEELVENRKATKAALADAAFPEIEEEKKQAVSDGPQVVPNDHDIPDDRLTMELRKLVKENIGDDLARERSLQKFTRLHGLPVSTVRDSAKKLVAEFNKKQNEFAKREHAESPLDSVIEKINKEHAVIQYENRVLILCEVIDPVLNRAKFALLPQADFRLKFCNKVTMVPKGDKVVPVEWGDYWLKHKDRREYNGIVFDPKSTERDGYYNLWKGLSVASKQGNCVLFRRHILEVICAGNGKKYDYFWKWCAHAVQRPWDLPEVAIVMRSPPGTGKNTVVNALGKIFGRHYLPLTNNNLLCGRFNSHLADAVLVFANEAVWGGDKQGKGRLKAMITDPIETVEAKGKDAFAVPNFKRIIIASNEDWAVPRGIGDRRFFCLDVSPYRKGNSEYFAALHKEINNGGVEAFLHELLATDLEDWHPRHSMPEDNTDGEDMKIKSLSTPLEWWLHALVVGGNTLSRTEWDTTAPLEDMHKAYLQWCADHRKHHVAHITKFKSELKAAFEFEVTRPGARSEKRSRVRMVPSLNECRVQFQARVAKYDFDEDGEDGGDKNDNGIEF